jgi:hypothetical protein
LLWTLFLTITGTIVSQNICLSTCITLYKVHRQMNHKHANHHNAPLFWPEHWGHTLPEIPYQTTTPPPTPHFKY